MDDPLSVLSLNASHKALLLLLLLTLFMLHKDT